MMASALETVGENRQQREQTTSYSGESPFSFSGMQEPTAVIFSFLLPYEQGRLRSASRLLCQLFSYSASWHCPSPLREAPQIGCAATTCPDDSLLLFLHAGGSTWTATGVGAGGEDGGFASQNINNNGLRSPLVTFEGSTSSAGGASASISPPLHRGTTFINSVAAPPSALLEDSSKPVVGGESLASASYSNSNSVVLGGSILATQQQQNSAAKYPAHMQQQEQQQQPATALTVAVPYQHQHQAAAAAQPSPLHRNLASFRNKRISVVIPYEPLLPSSHHHHKISSTKNNSRLKHQDGGDDEGPPLRLNNNGGSDGAETQLYSPTNSDHSSPRDGKKVAVTVTSQGSSSNGGAGSSIKDVQNLDSLDGGGKGISSRSTSDLTNSAEAQSRRATLFSVNSSLPEGEFYRRLQSRRLSHHASKIAMRRRSSAAVVFKQQQNAAGRKMSTASGALSSRGAKQRTLSESPPQNTAATSPGQNNSNFLTKPLVSIVGNASTTSTGVAASTYYAQQQNNKHSSNDANNSGAFWGSTTGGEQGNNGHIPLAESPSVDPLGGSAADLNANLSGDSIPGADDSITAIFPPPNVIAETAVIMPEAVSPGLVTAAGSGVEQEGTTTTATTTTTGPATSGSNENENEGSKKKTERYRKRFPTAVEFTLGSEHPTHGMMEDSTTSSGYNTSSITPRTAFNSGGEIPPPALNLFSPVSLYSAGPAPPGSYPAIPSPTSGGGGGGGVHRTTTQQKNWSTGALPLVRVADFFPLSNFQELTKLVIATDSSVIPTTKSNTKTKSEDLEIDGDTQGGQNSPEEKLSGPSKKSLAALCLSRNLPITGICISHPQLQDLEFLVPSSESLQAGSSGDTTPARLIDKVKYFSLHHTPKLVRLPSSLFSGLGGNSTTLFPSSLVKCSISNLDRLEEIGSNCFSECHLLEEFSLTNLPQLRTIESNLLLNCENLESFSLAGTPLLQSIGMNFLCGTRSLVEVSFSPPLVSLRSIDTGFLKGSGLEEWDRAVLQQHVNYDFPPGGGGGKRSDSNHSDITPPVDHHHYGSSYPSPSSVSKRGREGAGGNLQLDHSRTLPMGQSNNFSGSVSAGQNQGRRQDDDGALPDYLPQEATNHHHHLVDDSGTLPPPTPAGHGPTLSLGSPTGSYAPPLPPPPQQQQQEQQFQPSKQPELMSYESLPGTVPSQDPHGAAVGSSTPVSVSGILRSPADGSLGSRAGIKAKVLRNPQTTTNTAGSNANSSSHGAPSPMAASSSILSSAVFPTLKELGPEFLSGCNNLLNVELTSNTLPQLISLPLGSLKACGNLERVVISDLPCLERIAGGGCLSHCPFLEEVHLYRLPKLVSIGDHFLSDNPSLLIVTMGRKIPKLKTINEGFMASCSQMEEFTLSDLPGLKTISHQFLSGCENLKKVQIQNLPQLTTIGGSFIDRCSSLMEARIGPGLSGLLEIGGKCLSKCPELHTVHVEEDSSPTTSIGQEFLSECPKLKTLTFPSKVRKVAADCLQNCESLKSVELPDFLREIGSRFLYQVSQLEEITFPPRLVSMDKYCLFKCDAITSLTISGIQTLRSIGDSCFENCASLRMIRIEYLPVLEAIGRNCGSLNNQLEEAYLGPGMDRFRKLSYGWLLGNPKLKTVHMKGCPLLIKIGQASLKDWVREMRQVENTGHSFGQIFQQTSYPGGGTKSSHVGKRKSGPGVAESGGSSVRRSPAVYHQSTTHSAKGDMDDDDEYLYASSSKSAQRQRSSSYPAAENGDGFAAREGLVVEGCGFGPTKLDDDTTGCSCSVQ